MDGFLDCLFSSEVSCMPGQVGVEVSFTM
jgi:hypothetical protein